MTISPSYPNLLQNGNPADASQVMADFYQIQNDVNANAAHNGANSDITSLTGLVTPLSIAQGGTGATSFAAAGLATLTAPAFTGPVSITGALTVSTTLGVTGATTLTGAATLSNTLHLVGAGTFDSSLAVAGALSANSLGIAVGAAVGGNLIVTGSSTLTAGGSTPTLPVNNRSTGIASTAFANPAANLASPGSVTLPSGIILKWGQTGSIGSGGSASTNFDTAFPSTCYGVQITNQTAAIGGTPSAVTSISASAFTTFNAGGGSETFYYFAVGR